MSELCPECRIRPANTLKGIAFACDRCAAFEQPTMHCPRCQKEYPDFDGFGVVFCDPGRGGCGYCKHLSYDGVGDGTWKCNFCGKVKTDE